MSFNMASLANGRMEGKIDYLAIISASPSLSKLNLYVSKGFDLEVWSEHSGDGGVITSASCVSYRDPGREYDKAMARAIQTDQSLLDLPGMRKKIAKAARVPRPVVYVENILIEEELRKERRKEKKERKEKEKKELRKKERKEKRENEKMEEKAKVKAEREKRKAEKEQKKIEREKRKAEKEEKREKREKEKIRKERNRDGAGKGDKKAKERKEKESGEDVFLVMMKEEEKLKEEKEKSEKKKEEEPETFVGSNCSVEVRTCAHSVFFAR